MVKYGEEILLDLLKMFNLKSLLNVFSRFTPIIFGILPAFFTARFLGPENFAEYNLIFVFVTLTTNIFIAPFGTYLNNNSVSFLKKNILAANLAYFLKYNFIVYLFLSSTLYFYLDLSLINLNFFQLFIISFGIFFLNTLLQTFLSVLNYLGDILFFNIFTALFVVFSIASSLVFIYVFDVTVFNWILGTIIIQFFFLVFLIMYFQLKKYIIFSQINIKDYDFSIIVKIFKYASPLLLTNFTMWIVYQAYKFYLPDLMGLSQAGIFLAGYGLASITASLVERVSLVIIWPVFFKKNENLMSMNNIDLNEYLKFILNCLFVIFIILFIYGDFLISVVLGEDYAESYLYLILGIMAESLRVFINSLFVVYYLKKNTKSIFYYHLFIALLFFLLLFIFRESINVFIIISSLSFSILISITYFLFINNNLKLSLNIKFLIVIGTVFTLIYFSSFAGSFFFNISKYCFSSLLVIFLVKKIYNYLKNLLIIKIN
jgi:O-antigen/teichoic acid export membrane protein